MIFPEYKSDQLSVFDELPTGVLVNVVGDDGKLQFEYANPFFAESLGYTHEELVELLTKNVFAAIYDADSDRAQNGRDAVMRGEIVDSISRQKKKDGTFVWIHAHIRRIRVDGREGMMLLFSRIQELIGLQNELSAKNKEWSDILQSIPMGLLVYREENGVRTTLSINRALVELANSVGSQLDSKHREWNEEEFAMILNQDIYAFCEDEDKHLVAGMLKGSETMPTTGCVFRLRGSSVATPVYIYTTCASKETEEGGRIYYVTYQNVTEAENRRKELFEKQNQLYHMSYYDALTGVKNRNAYNKFAESCKTSPIHNVGFAFCDINGLKKTNDTLGHYYGDHMIKRFAGILKDSFKTENIYRLSGDEFVVICPDTECDVFQQKMDAVVAGVKAADNIASIGYIWKEDVSNVARRSTQAEQIMYVEKQRYYETSRTINSKHRSTLLETLLNEFDEGRFVMFLQPKTAIDGSKVIGAEALVRKYDADGNILLPYGFVPQLEHEMLIPRLDYFMLEQTCQFLQDMHRAGKDDFSVSVNISRVTIVENEFMETVTAILNKYDFIRSNLEFELTESNKTLDPIRLEDYLSRLKNLGAKLSLDDMGNDYSSLPLLILDGFDWVKLDRSLIIQLSQEKARILVKHVINACHEMGLKVIAEGVETDDIRQILQDMNCDAYQGYLKSKPVSVVEFKDKFLN